MDVVPQPRRARTAHAARRSDGQQINIITLLIVKDKIIKDANAGNLSIRNQTQLVHHIMPKRAAYLHTIALVNFIVCIQHIVIMP